MTDDSDLERLLPGRQGMVVRLVGKQGGRPVLLDALHRYADRLDEEPGTEAFVVALDPASPETVWLVEWFRDPQAWDAHRSAPAFAELMTTLSEALAEPPGLLRLDPLRLHLGRDLLQPSPDGSF